MKRYIELIILILTIFVQAFAGDKANVNIIPNKPENKLLASISTFQEQIPVLTRKPENTILQIVLNVNHPVVYTIESIKIDLEGTSDVNDIESITLFYIENTSKPEQIKQFGQVLGPAKRIIFTGQLPLNKPVASFKVSVRLKNNIDLLHKINASCEYIETDAGLVKGPGIKASKGLRVGIALRKHGDANVNTFRIPGLTTTKKGTLLAIYDVRRQSGRDLQGDIDIGLSRSTDGGNTWEPMRIVLDRGTWGGLPQKFNGVSDACILVNGRNNDIFVAGLWMHGILDKNGQWIERLDENSSEWEHQWKSKGSQPGFSEKQTCQFLLTKSSDDGLSWTEPVNLTSMCKKEEWWLWAPAPGHGITLEDGTLVFPTQGRDESGKSFSNITWSKDGGISWKASNAAATGTTENMVVELRNKEIMINMRSNENKNNLTSNNGRVVAVTRNLGESWTVHPTSRSALIEPTCMASIHKHECISKGSKKTFLLFSNPHSRTSRDSMTIQISFDDGVTWPGKNHILLDAGKGRGYSCITSIDEKTIGILYEGSQSDLIFQKISLNDLLKP